MRRSPSIVPHGADCDTYVVLNDFGALGPAWCEADEQGTDRKTLIRRLMEDQYSHPVRIVAFNTAEGWARDVTEDIARAVLDRAQKEDRPITEKALRSF